MTRATLATLALLVLAACGADGPPERHEDAVRIDRSGTIGVSGGL